MPNVIKNLILFILAVYVEYGNSWDYWQRLGKFIVPRTAGEHWREWKRPTNTDGHKDPLNIRTTNGCSGRRTGLCSAQGASAVIRNMCELYEWEEFKGFSECPKAFQYCVVNPEDKTLN